MADIFEKKLKEYLFDKPGIAKILKTANYVTDGSIVPKPITKNDKYMGIKIEGNIDFYERGFIDFWEYLDFVKKSYKPSKIQITKNSYSFNYINENNDLQLAYHSKREKCYKNLNSYPDHKHTGPLETDYDEGNKLITLGQFVKEVEQNYF